jgi:predicted outer membrane repeat protein
MRRAPGSWTGLLTQLGLKRRREGTATRLCRRHRVEVLEDRRVLATFIVSTPSDVNDTIGDDHLSLREAIAIVHAGVFSSVTEDDNTFGLIRSSGELSEDEKDQISGVIGVNDVIDLTGLSGVIELTGDFEGVLGEDSSLPIRGNLQIIGPGSGVLTIDGMETSQIFVADDAVTTDATVTIEGVTLTRGNADGEGGSGAAGGAIYSLTNLTLIDVVFDDNHSLTDGGALYAGSVDGTTTLHLDNVAFTDNVAGTKGGGFYANSVTSISVSGMALGSVAHPNQAEYGGGAYVEMPSFLTFGETAYSKLEITDSRIAGNVAVNDGGGIYIDNHQGSEGGGYSGDAIIAKTVLSHNEAGWSGGGVYSKVRNVVGNNDFFDGFGAFVVDECLLSDNVAGKSGGGIYCKTESNGQLERTAVDFRNSTFHDNAAEGDDDAVAGGGAIYLEAGFWGGNTPVPTIVHQIVNCTVSGNSARNGGGLLLIGAVDVRHSTIVHNTAGLHAEPEEVTSGSGVLIANATPRLAGLGPDDYTFQGQIASFSHCIVARNGNGGVSGTNIGVHYSSGFPAEIFLYPDYTTNGIEPVYLSDVCLAGDDHDDDVTNEQWDIWQEQYYVDLTFEYSIIDHRNGPLAPCIESRQQGELMGFEDNTFIEVDPHFGETTDPLFAPLAANGGVILVGGTAIPTHRLRAGSRAVNAGDPEFTAATPLVPQNPPEVWTLDHEGVDPGVLELADLDVDERGAEFDRVFLYPGTNNGGEIDIGAFELQFYIPPTANADFNDNTVVEGGDFLIWQRNAGRIDVDGDSRLSGDADGNGNIDLNDLYIWRQQFGQTIVSTSSFDQNPAVDGYDLMIWQANRGMTGASQGDGDADGNGIVDIDDYLAWQIAYSIETGLLKWMVHTLDLKQLAHLTSDQILVSTLEDSSDGDYTLGDLSLREALEIADELGGSRQIVFANHLAGTIKLNGTQLDIASDVDIIGPGIDRITIDAGGDSRVFGINGSYTVAIRGLKITGGNLVNQGGGIYNNNSGSLMLDSVRVTDNQTNLTGSVNGGGVYSAYGSLSIINSTFDENDSRYGGGLYVYVDQSSDVVLIANSTISDNTAYDGSQTGAGGGITISSTSGNNNVTILGTTISGNSAGHSGGVRIAGGPVAIVNSTITDNDAFQSSEGAQGGGIAVVSSGALTLNNTIVADNTAYSGYPDLVNWATVNTSSNNLIGDVGNSGITNTNGNVIILTSGDPGLLPLGDYGGPTKTHALEYNSQAINAGNNGLIMGAAVDQRGYHRAVSRSTSTHTVDIGAYELGLVVSTDVDDNDTTYSYGDFSLREALYLASFITGTNEIEFDPDLLDGETITLTHGQLSIDSNVRILGLGEDSLAVDANGASRVFSLNGTYDATISGLTITGGAGVNQGGGIYNNNNGTLRLDGVRITGNQTNLTGSVNGGGVYSAYGSLYVTNSTIDANDSRYGGGLYIYVDQSTDVVEILSSTISNNTAYVGDQTGSGGGLTISSTSGNNNILIANTTISGNSAGHSGGMRIAGGPVTILGSTITDNHALQSTDGAQGGGVAVVSSGSLTIINSIVADNTAYGGYADLVNWATVNTTLSVSNLIGDAGNSGLSTSANIVIGTSGDPGLMPLADNGGPTWTHKLENGSQAIDAGNAVAASLYLFDQRGSLRFDDGNGDALVGLDIGAFELSADEYFEGLGA